MVKVKRVNSISSKKEEISRTEEKPKTKTIKKIQSKRTRNTEVFLDPSVIDARTRERGSRYGLWVIALISLVVLFFAFSVLFWKAKVVVHPNIENFTLNSTFLASKDPDISNLPFELVVISGEETKMVPTGEPQNYSERATGTAVLYNIYSFSPQKLAIDTRLEGSNGKIYKTKIPIEIPSITAEGLPGSVEVPIYAENPGVEYNSSPLDFKILGFKGTPKYEDFYGRSKGEISGGISGVLRSVSDVNKIMTLNSLKAVLKSKLFKKASEQIPEGFVFFPDATSFIVDEENVGFSESGEAPVSIKGTLSGILFKETDLSQKIISSLMPEGEDNNLYIPHVENLKFSFPETENLFWDSEKVNFKLSGELNIVSKVNADSVKLDVLGKKKSDFEDILSAHKEIDSAELVVRPFWKQSLPEDSKDIDVEVEYPQ